MIKINNVSFSYGNEEVIKDFSRDFKKGKTYAIMGKSGIGKTTLLRLIADLEKPKKGTIEGIENEKKTFIFQENRLLPWLTVNENLEYVTKDKEKIEKALFETGLLEHKDKKESELSGGMARRAAIARALAYGGDVFFIDEPLYGLDKETAHGILEILKKVLKGKTAFVITHSQNEAEFLANEIILL